MSERKNGRPSKEDYAFIEANMDKLTAEQIAAELGRNPTSIEVILNTRFKGRTKKRPEEPAAVARAVRRELRTSMSWTLLKKEFSEEEMAYFEEKYAALTTQFKDDVTPSEESQIFQAVKFEILMHRALAAKRRCLEDVERLDRMREEFLEGKTRGQMDKTDEQYLLDIETQIQSAMASEQSRSKEYGDLHKEHSGLMKTLKATRDQRIQQIESGKVSMTGLLKMLQDHEIRQKEGRLASLGKMAAEKEHDRLAAPHQYLDGKVDRPILTAETVSREEPDDDDR